MSRAKKSKAKKSKAKKNKSQAKGQAKRGKAKKGIRKLERTPELWSRDHLDCVASARRGLPPGRKIYLLTCG